MLMYRIGWYKIPNIIPKISPQNFVEIKFLIDLEGVGKISDPK